MKTKHLCIVAALSGALLTASAEGQVLSTTDSSVETPVAAASRFSVKAVKPLQYKVVLANVQAKRLVVRILDANRDVLFSEYATRKSGDYTRLFDLSPLSDGSYTIEVTEGAEKFTHSFDILTQTNRIVASKNVR
jgi:hypothetical protein